MRRLDYGCPFPTRNPLKTVQTRIAEMKESGDLDIGDPIMTYSIQTHKITSQSTITAETLNIPSRKIPIDRLLRNEFDREIKAGLLDIYNDMESMSAETVCLKLKSLGGRMEG